MISVCIATFNGEKTIIRQLDSVLSQLNTGDEIIIVDDCSTDATINILNELKSISSFTFKIYSNMENIGPIKSFERAIQYSSNNYIFLCDQDDEWFPNKVSVILSKFETLKYDLVVHDATVIDGSNNIIDSSWNHYNGNNLNQNILGNIIKNAFTGCMMAFTKELANKTMPFPENIDMHDQWIALVALKHHFNIDIINKSLMYYVRHGNNVTGIKQRTLSEMIKGRVYMTKAIIENK